MTALLAFLPILAVGILLIVFRLPASRAMPLSYIVAAGLAQRCEVQLAYAIGVAEPVSVLVDTFGTNEVDESKIESAIRDIFPLKPAGRIEHLDMLRPIYQNTAAYGHFGRTEDSFTWEKTDKAEDLRAAL